MGVSSCTGPVCEEELQAIMLVDVEGDFTANSSTFSASQDSITIEYPHWEEYTKSQLKNSLY